VLVGVRPEHLGVELRGSGEGATEEGPVGLLAGTVEAVEPLIADRAQLVHVAVAAGPAEGAGGAGGARVSGGSQGGATVTLTARAPQEPFLARAVPVWLRLDPERILLFDGATERALRP
jgi:hypothetical protein